MCVRLWFEVREKQQAECLNIISRTTAALFRLHYLHTDIDRQSSVQY